MDNRPTETRATHARQTGGGTASPAVWAALEAMLLSNGGTRVARVPEQHAEELLARGRRFDLPAKARGGRLGICHARAAALWGRNVERFRLVTGYLLGPPGVWIQHSWVVDDRRIYDAGVSGRYFGVALEPREAAKFWCANYFGPFYRGPAAIRKQGGPGRAASAALSGALRNTLTAIGGTGVADEEAPWLPDLAARGLLCTQAVKGPGRPRRSCVHVNAAARWGRDVGRYRLATGYALGEDGLWRPHSWVTEPARERLIETSRQRALYFGAELTDLEAVGFWVDHFLEGRYAGVGAIMDGFAQAKTAGRATR